MGTEAGKKVEGADVFPPSSKNIGHIRAAKLAVNG